MLQLIHILLLNVSNCNTLTISFSSTNMQFFHNRISVFNLFILIFIMNHRHKTYTGSFHDIHILYFPFPLLPGSPGGHVKSRNYFDIFCIGLYFYSIIKRILNILTQDFPPVSELNPVSYTNATMLSYSLVPAASSTDDLDMRSVLAHDSLVLVSSVITDISQNPVSQRLNCSDPDNVYLQGINNTNIGWGLWGYGASFHINCKKSTLMGIISGESLLKSILNYDLASELLMTGNIVFDNNLRANINLNLKIMKGGKERFCGVYSSLNGGRLESNLTVETGKENIIQNYSRTRLHILVL